jgi:hypothetical protein
LQGFVEFANGFLIVDSFVTLQKLNCSIRGACNRIRQLGLSAAGGPFQQERFM